MKCNFTRRRYAQAYRVGNMPVDQSVELLGMKLFEQLGENRATLVHSQG